MTMVPPGNLARPPGSGSGLSLPGGLPGTPPPTPPLAAMGGSTAPPGGGMPPIGMPPPVMQAIMKMLPPQVVQAIAANPAIIPGLVQRFLPLLLGRMGGAPTGPMPPSPVPPRGMPPGGVPMRRPPPPGFARRPPTATPGAFTGNGQQAPPAQGAINPMSTEDELAMTQKNMGSRNRNF
jgi:hypothetical protein